jgi:hypothetical protein
MPVRRAKLGMAIMGGLLVGVIAGATHYLMLPRDFPAILLTLIGDLIAALTTIVVCLAIQLRHEEIYYQTAVDRAGIVGELNHHIRNAIFPLTLAVHSSHDTEAIRIAGEAVERINIALKDATVDALSGRVQYGKE